MRRRVWFAGLALLAVLVAGLAALKAYRDMKRGRSSPPPPGMALTADPVETGGLPRGFVVWSSNRYGNHDILRMDLPDRRITRLTRHPHTEYFPRLDPSGRRLVFARSQRPWVSQRDPVAWDVVLLDLASGRERVVARFGNSPTWSPDGRKIYFQRNVGQLVEWDLASGRERVVLRAGTGGLPGGLELQTPVVDAAGHIAVTFRRAQRMTAIVAEGTVTRVGGGCQLAWTPAGGRLYYVDHGGRQENAIYLYDPANRERRLWLDLPGEFSHEYFPRLSRDGRWLVFGASRGDHEHDSADYEIFLWRVGSPAGQAIRLTYHTGNDNWPDIWIAGPR